MGIWLSDDGYLTLSNGKLICQCFCCDYFKDDFSRADSSNIGPNWTVQSGTWSISSYRLHTTSANARIDCTPNWADFHPKLHIPYAITTYD